MWWTIGAAGPLRSFIDDKPVCMSCRAGVLGGDASQGYCEGDYGLPGLRAYVGPGLSRGIEDEDGEISSAIDDSKPWFAFAAESAAPRRVHLAKALIMAEGESGWTRNLEIDGHDVSHVEPDWQVGVEVPEYGYMTRFAVFAFPRDSAEISRRAELERIIRHFAENYAASESAEALAASMAADGFDPELIHEVESLSSLAFGRELFRSHGVQFPATIIRAHRDGRVEPDVPLMSFPAFNRARAMFPSLIKTIPEADLQSLCFYSAEANALVQALQSDPDIDMSSIKMYPCVVPDHGASDETMDAAFASLQALVERNRRPNTKVKKSR